MNKMKLVIAKYCNLLSKFKVNKNQRKRKRKNLNCFKAKKLI